MATTLINWLPESVSHPRHRVRNNSGIVLPAYDKMIDTVYRVARPVLDPSPPISSDFAYDLIESFEPPRVCTWNKRPGT